MNRYLRHLIRLFLKAETDIINEISLLRAKGNIDYHAVAALARVQKILRNLEAEGWEYVPKMIEMEFYVNHPEERRILEPIEKHLAGYANALALTSARTEVAEILVRNCMASVTEACENTAQNLGDILIGRREDDLYRRAGMEYVLQRQAVGATLKTHTQEFFETLNKEGVTCFTDKAGRNWSLHTYGTMVLRTTSKQASDLSVLTQEPDRDLYKISEIGTTCPVCAPLEGRVYSRSGLDPDFPPLAEAYGLIDPGGPKVLENTWLCIHPNCLVPGGTVLAQGVVAHSSRDYDGAVIRLVTSSGNEITVTPNHPILTTEGFLPAGSLHEGQKVIEATGEYGRFIGQAPNNIDVPTLVEQIPNTLVHSCQCTTSRVKSTPEQFHGDGSVDGEVNIVFANGFRRNERDILRFKKFLKQHFPSALFGGLCFDTKSTIREVLVGALRSANSVVSRFGFVRRIKSVPINGEQFSNLGHRTTATVSNLGECQSLVMKGKHRFKLLSVRIKECLGNGVKTIPLFRNDDSVVNASTFDCLERYPEMFRNLVVAEPLCAKGLDTAFRNGVFVVSELSHVEQSSYQGKVYNLQTEQGFYTYNNIVTHNCLHSLTPWTRAGKTEEEIERIKRFSSFETNPRSIDPRSEAQVKAYEDKMRARAKFNRDYKQWERYRETIPDAVPKTFATFMKHKTLNDDKYKAWMAEYRHARKEG